MSITLGAEEELQIVCSKTGALSEHEHMELEKDWNHAGTMTTEIHRCVLELQTRICSHPDEVAAALGVLRSSAIDRAAAQGQRILATGVHPFSCWKTQSLFDNKDKYPHYAHLLDEYGDIARGALSFGMHVHLGLPDTSFRMPVMNSLRHVLPEILALSVSAPYFDGRDTGLQSWRHCLLGRYPRMGIPDTWENEDLYFAHVDKLRSTGCIEPTHGLWEDIRLHHRYKTIEVRIADTTPSLEWVWLIVALLQCEAQTLVNEIQGGQSLVFWPRNLIEENKWRVRRYGQDALLIDWSDSSIHAFKDRLPRWLARLAPVADRLGYYDELRSAIDHAIARGTCAQQQRVLRGRSKNWTDFALRMVDQTENSAIAARSRWGAGYGLA